MNRFAVVVLLVVSNAVFAQAPNGVPAPKPTPEELAFARLPADLQQMLGGMTAAQAMQTVQQTEQHAIALGMPRPTPEHWQFLRPPPEQPAARRLPGGPRRKSSSAAFR